MSIGELANKFAKEFGKTLKVKYFIRWTVGGKIVKVKHWNCEPKLEYVDINPKIENISDLSIV